MGASNVQGVGKGGLVNRREDSPICHLQAKVYTLLCHLVVGGLYSSYDGSPVKL